MEYKSESEISNDNSGKKFIYVIGCLGLAGLCVFTIIVGGLIFGWREFVSFGIANDITEYIELVERAEVDPALRNDVLDRFYLLRDRARDGDHVSFLIWIDYDTAILSYIETGPISETDLTAVQRELDSIERELDGN